MLNNILVTLKNKQQPFEPLTLEQIQAYYQHTPDIIKAALQPYGYFKAIVQVHQSQHGRTWRFYFNVQPGPRLIIKSVELNLTGPGRNEAKLIHAQKNFPIQVKSPFQSEDYEKAKHQWLKSAEALGYITARLTRHIVLINPKTNTAKIALTLETGPRYYFGPLRFKQTVLDESLLQRYIHFKTGDVYSSQTLLNLQQDLSNSHYFKNVEINSDPNQAQNNRVPIFVKLTPRKSQQYKLGLGYGTDTGIRGSLAWLWRRLNRQGHHLAATFNASNHHDSFLASYYIPAANPATDQWAISVGLGNDHPSEGDSHTRQITLAYNTAHPFWRITHSLSYQRERYRLDNFSSYQSARILMPTTQWTWIQRDDPLFTRKGYRLDWQLRGASEQLLSVTSFVQGQLSGKVIFPISKNNRILLRGAVGGTAGKALHDKLPLTLRFFSGGSRNVRGYSYHDLGPGNYLLEGSGEYQQHLYRKWYVSAFYDAGNAKNHFGMHLNKGAGLGLLWVSPIGPIAVTWAKALSRSGHPNRIQIAMGPDLVA